MCEGTTKLRIKAALAADLPLVISLRNTLFRESGVGDDLLVPAKDELLAKFYEQETGAGRMRHYLAFNQHNAVVGVTGALLKSDFPYFLNKPGYYGWILDVYILPEVRRQGLAHQLLALNLEWLKQQGAQEVKLITFTTEATRLYEKIGFKTTKEMSYKLTEGKTVNDVIGNAAD